MTTLPRGRYLDRATPPHISTLIVLTGLGAMSMNVFLPSLPGMAAYFSADYALMQLSISLYLAVNAVLQLFIGPVSDRYGRRPVLLASLALFCLATTGCILAPSAGIFLAFRMAQGVIVAGLVLGRAVVRDMVPQEQAASMIGYVTMGMAVVPMISPAVGGLLDQAFGWHSTFILLLVAGLVVLWLTWSDLGETAQNRATSLRDQFRQYPELFASHRFWGYCLSATFASGAFFAFIGGAPFVGVQVYGLDSVQVGLCVGAPALGYFSGNFLLLDPHGGQLDDHGGGGHIDPGHGLPFYPEPDRRAWANAFLRRGHAGGAGKRIADAQRQCRNAVGTPASGRIGIGYRRGDHDLWRRAFVGACRLDAGAGVHRDAADRDHAGVVGTGTGGDLLYNPARTADFGRVLGLCPT